jgi:hypothetical protein
MRRPIAVRESFPARRRSTSPGLGHAVTKGVEIVP